MHLPINDPRESICIERLLFLRHKAKGCGSGGMDKTQRVKVSREVRNKEINEKYKYQYIKNYRRSIRE